LAIGEKTGERCQFSLFMASITRTAGLKPGAHGERRYFTKTKLALGGQRQMGPSSVCSPLEYGQMAKSSSFLNTKVAHHRCTLLKIKANFQIIF
jgi:hypothetical protein